MARLVMKFGGTSVADLDRNLAVGGGWRFVARGLRL